MTEEGFEGPLAIIRRRPAQVRKREKSFRGTYITLKVALLGSRCSHTLSIPLR